MTVGRFYVRDIDRRGVAYVSQEPWLQHGTVRQNILFGKPYQAELYDTVVSACALTSDFKQMPNGDMSEVGEQGVTLSGRQRARIALARAVYQNKDIYLLDDPLSAVDVHVAKYLFTRCIRGLLKGKTVVLDTHHVDYLRDADSVVVVKGGSIEGIGPPAKILDESNWLQAMQHDEHASMEVGASAPAEVEALSTEQAPEGGEPVLVLQEEREVIQIPAVCNERYQWKRYFLARKI